MFRDREEAGEKLAARLLSLPQLYNLPKKIVLAIPRGGVVVGQVLAKKLDCPLNVIVVKKIGAPFQPELAIGAVSQGNVQVLDSRLVEQTDTDTDYLNREIETKNREIEERIRKFGVKELNLTGKNVILTDDGIATGATVEAAIKCISSKKPKSIILAIPVAPPEAVSKFQKLVDQLIILKTPSFFTAVGQFYQHFPQINDDEVTKILEEGNKNTLN